MTSRRQFFGLLAAAPLVAPAVVKEMVGPKVLHFEMTAGELVDVRAFRVAPGESFFPARMGVIKRLDGKPIRFATDISDDTPNRLYGSHINADGDAV